VVARHQLGISVGTMNFSRNLLATMLIAVFGTSGGLIIFGRHQI
jgi:hypothetical protein